MCVRDRPGPPSLIFRPISARLLAYDLHMALVQHPQIADGIARAVYPAQRRERGQDTHIRHIIVGKIYLFQIHKTCRKLDILDLIIRHQTGLPGRSVPHSY